MNVWLWNQRDRRFEEPTEDISSWTLVAADSWFVEDSRMRAFDRHQARFARAAAEVTVGEAVTGDFWAAVLEKIPATGSGSLASTCSRLRLGLSGSWHSVCGRLRSGHGNCGYSSRRFLILAPLRTAKARTSRCLRV